MVATTSLVLCTAIAGLWVHSHVESGWVHVRVGSRIAGATSFRGGAYFWLVPGRVFGTDAGISTSPIHPHDLYIWRKPDASAFGFGYAADAGTHKFVSAPLWFPLLAAGGVGLWAVRRRARDTSGPGVCAACGYDLMATPGRCPECGALAGDPAAA
jgi:hypothetical protein